MLAPAIAQSNSFASCTGHGRIGMIDTRDVAALAAEITAALKLFADGDADYVTDTIPRLLQRPARTFRDVATDHSQAFA